MNKRMQELAEQAWNATAVSPEFGHPVTFAKTLSKLLVQECVDIVENLPNGYKDYRNQIEDAFRRDCIASMNAHFGVES